MCGVLSGVKLGTLKDHCVTSVNVQEPPNHILVLADAMVMEVIEMTTQEVVEGRTLNGMTLLARALTGTEAAVPLRITSRKVAIKGRITSLRARTVAVQ